MKKYFLHYTNGTIEQRDDLPDVLVALVGKGVLNYVLDTTSGKLLIRGQEGIQWAPVPEG